MEASWETGTSVSHMSKGEYVQILAKRLLYSRAYTCFYASMIVAGIVEVGGEGRPRCAGLMRS